MLRVLVVVAAVEITTSLQATWSHFDIGKGMTGPDDWGEPCKKGSQSPINLLFEGASEASEGIEYKCDQIEEYEIENVQTTIKITPTGTSKGACKLKIGERDGNFVLQSYHFHTPSEHAVEGKRYDMEMHFVNVNEAGEIAVLGVFFDAAESADEGDSWLATFWDNLQQVPLQRDELKSVYESQTSFKATAKRVTKAIPPFGVEKSTECFMYSGSLTTPPCTTGLYWNVIVKPRKVSKEQVQRFRKMMSFSESEGNARPIQPTQVPLKHFYMQHDTKPVSGVPGVGSWSSMHFLILFPLLYWVYRCVSRQRVKPTSPPQSEHHV